MNDPAALNATFLILHAAFLAAFFRINGTDFGAQCIESIITKLDESSKGEGTAVSSKQTLNLASLLAHLYNLGVVNSNLIFDVIREYLDVVTEAHTELLLRLVRSCGYKLRQDDPGAIKDIANMLQKQTAKDSEVSVRTKFMVEELARLRDNKQRSAVASFGKSMLTMHEMSAFVSSQDHPFDHLSLRRACSWQPTLRSPNI